MSGREGDDGQVVNRRVSAWGMHELHVVRVGRAPGQVFWLRQAEQEGADPSTFTCLSYEEGGTFHLRLFWKNLVSEVVPPRLPGWNA